MSNKNKEFNKILDENGQTLIQFFNEAMGYYPDSVVNIEKTTKNYRGIIGYGIHPEVKNKYVQLGRYILNYHSLYYKNYFKLYSKKHQSITGLQGINVSDTFVHIIQKLINYQHVSKEDLEMLSPNE